jgi:putative transposase
VQFLCVGFQVSERRACQAIGIQRSSYRYRSTARDQTALKMRIRDLAATRVRYGYRRLHVLLQREGWFVNHKRVYRLYRQEGLSLRLKTRKKRVSVGRVPQLSPTAPNQRWSMDFMSDRLYDGRRFRILTLVDNMTRESLALEVNRSFSGRVVADVLERLTQTTGLPKLIQVDNGPEFVSKALDEWAHHRQVKLVFSRPGTPTDNPFIEAFNGRFRQECLDQNWFESLDDARSIIEAWRQDYNTIRPHSSLDHLTPVAYKEKWFQEQRLAGNG